MARRSRPKPLASEQSSAPAVRPTRTVTTKISQSSYEGPLPPSAELAAYESVQPGAADRIISMAEDYAGHRQALEVQAMRHEASAQVTGRAVAAGVVLAVLLSCLYALELDKDDFAIRLGSSTVLALAGIFIAGRIPDWLRKRGP